MRDTEKVNEEAFIVHGAVHGVELRESLPSLTCIDAELFRQSTPRERNWYTAFKDVDDAMAVRKAHAEDLITFNKIAHNIEYALPEDYVPSIPHKVLHVRRPREGTREPK